MRKWTLLAATVGALVLGAAASSAEASTQKFSYTSRAFTITGFDVLLPKVRVRAPHRTGYVTRMTAILIDGNGRRLSIRHVMLHHLVFLNDGSGSRGGATPRGSCEGRYGEPFYGTGEEHEHLLLPHGYGYRVQKNDRWRMQAMLMSHDIQTHKVRVRYSFTFVSGRRMKTVRPFWIRANGCTSQQPSYTVNPSSSTPGATTTRSFTWTVPFNGRIVAAGGHLHGGSVNMTLTQPRCSNRELLDTKPLYGDPGYLAYRIRPVLHEPGPKNTRYFMSATGIPVRKGEKIVLHGVYDATHPRARVMSIMHVYVTPEKSVPTGCEQLPSDIRELSLKDGVEQSPYIPIPLSKVTATGRPYTIQDPEGPTETFTGNAKVKVLGLFTPSIVSIPQGATLTWKFADSTPHNVLFASGPQVAGSPTLGKGASHTSHFTVPGTYKFFCYLHPVTMHQEVIVRPAAVDGADTVAPASAAPRAGKIPYKYLDVGA
jgi:plastocyanin